MRHDHKRGLGKKARHCACNHCHGQLACTYADFFCVPHTGLLCVFSILEALLDLVHTTCLFVINASQNVVSAVPN